MAVGIAADCILKYTYKYYKRGKKEFSLCVTQIGPLLP